MEWEHIFMWEGWRRGVHCTFFFFSSASQHSPRAHTNLAQAALAAFAESQRGGLAGLALDLRAQREASAGAAKAALAAETKGATERAAAAEAGAGEVAASFAADADALVAQVGACPANPRDPPL